MVRCTALGERGICGNGTLTETGRCEGGGKKKERARSRMSSYICPHEIVSRVSYLVEAVYAYARVVRDSASATAVRCVVASPLGRTA